MLVIIYTKKGDYRPASLLSVFDKLFEKLMYAKIISYICKHNVLYNRQFGFRSGHSTSMALLEFINYINTAFENKNIGLGIFLDLSKAFDSINHHILLRKLQFYGFRGISLAWIQSYLYNRKQFVCIDGINSRLLTLNAGVPQGSILGPLFFLLYVNDMQYVSPKFCPIIFADDTNLFVSGKNDHEISNIITSEIPKLELWFLANKLLVNSQKTNYMIFKKNQKQHFDNL